MGFFGKEYRKICKIFLTVNQPVTKKLEIFSKKNLVSSEKGRIFASQKQTKTTYENY